MKVSILVTIWLYLLSNAVANIDFKWVQPKCNRSRVGWSGCLRGQQCLPNGTCLSPQQVSIIHKRAYSVDARCGSDYGGLLCDPNSNVYFGTCCSQYGWCGSTAEYCGDGCQSGCDQDSSEAPNVVVYRDPPTVPSTPAAAGEPKLGQGQVGTATSSVPTPTGGVTTDGTCGVHSGDTVCGNWPKGSCCSMYGFCGNTTAHCGDGCQSGPCANGAIVPAPGPSPAPLNPNPGSFEIVGQSGVPAMHAGLMENGMVFFLDKIENYTQLILPDGQYAYSSEYDPNTNTVTPLSVSTNPFCSGGSFLSDGRIINVGGNGPLDFIDPTVGDGFDAIRYLQRSATDSSLNGQSWNEPGNKLSSARWYASAQTMADGSIFVASGSLNGLDPTVNGNNNPTFEILDTQGMSSGQSILMDILEKNQPYYMYPFMHLLRDGSLFVFVSKSAELFDVSRQTTIQTLPDLPGDYRTYPNTGGSVLLPLSSANGWDPELLICGGGAYQDVTSPTDPSCGRIQPLSENPEWEMDSMPEGRVMVEGTLLPDGTVIWMNGAKTGAQGFGLGRDPAFEVLIYDPSMSLGQRFSTGAVSEIPRLYHSVALLLLDGTIMVAGSNPVEQPKLVPDGEDPYVTEFRVERYIPPYLSGDKSNNRPSNIALSSNTLSADGSTFTVTFSAPAGGSAATVALYHGGFVTHSLHMSHRMAFLDNTGYVAGATDQTLTIMMPPSRNISPPGPYVMYVLVDGVPGYGQFVSVA